MRGGDSQGIRAYNERLIIDAILKGGALSKADLARRTGLSPNAAMVIANRLIKGGALRKLDPVRGKVGQPQTPIAVVPDSAYGIGVSIGRKSVQALLANLSGEVVASHESRHGFPDPGPTMTTAERQCRRLLEGLDEGQRERVVGLGVAMPNDLEAWSSELGLGEGALDGWREIDVATRLAGVTGLDVAVSNDAAAACAAELIAGEALTHDAALYLYFGDFIGGGIVIDGKLYLGSRQNAGAIGSMPTDGAQLLHRASLIQLEAMFEEAGLEPASAMFDDAERKADACFRRWMDVAAPATAHAVVAAMSVIDFEVVIIDGALPDRRRRALVERIGAEMARMNLAGLRPATLRAGTVGPAAPVLGAALAPMRARFSPDPDLLVRTKPPAAADVAHRLRDPLQSGVR